MHLVVDLCESDIPITMVTLTRWNDSDNFASLVVLIIWMIICNLENDQCKLNPIYLGASWNPHFLY